MPPNPLPARVRPMEFQVYSVVLEDRLRAGCRRTCATARSSATTGGATRSRASPSSAPSRARWPSSSGAPPRAARCACASRASCRRSASSLDGSDGADDGGAIALPALRRELEAEVRHRLQGGTLRVAERSFAHFYYYEHDPAAPSGRAVHRYAEVRYPSVGAWRAACQLRRDAELPRLERDAAAARAAAEGRRAAAPPPRGRRSRGWSARLARARRAWAGRARRGRRGPRRRRAGRAGRAAAAARAGAPSSTPSRASSTRPT